MTLLLLCYVTKQMTYSFFVFFIFSGIIAVVLLSIVKNIKWSGRNIDRLNHEASLRLRGLY